MKKNKIFPYNIKAGDRVFWHDPDNGICSRYLFIASIEWKENNIAFISQMDGDFIEVFANELSWKDDAKKTLPS